MYERFYRLTESPFQLMPNPRLLYKSRDHERALSYLFYGLKRREGFVVITGDVGTGKTLLLQTMLDQLGKQRLTVARVALANMGEEAVLPSVAGAFGVRDTSRNKYELMDALVAKLRSFNTKGALLVVDDAQDCSTQAVEELRSISNLQADGQALIQIFLIGQPELRTMLSRKRMVHLQQRIVASHHLQPLDANEVKAYVEHRLAAVSRKRRIMPEFGELVFDLVHQWTGGIPRRINQLMDRLLLYGYLEEKTRLTMSDLEIVIHEVENELAGSFADEVEETPSDESVAESPELAAVNQRMAALEQVLRTALGAEQANRTLAEHQYTSEHRALMEAQWRLARLESVFQRLLPEASKQTNGSTDTQLPAFDTNPSSSDEANIDNRREPDTRGIWKLR